MSSKTKSRQLADGADAQNEQISKVTREIYIPVITLRRYCDITGETAQAVHDRRRKGEWVDGKHCHMKRGRLWIDVPGIANWVRSEA
jgi:hypothetical protein